MNMSICGTDCSQCDCYGEMCQGCNVCQGRVFHCGGAECPIYHCCVSEHGFDSCRECAKLPCDIWEKNRDPRYSDEEFQASIEQRVLKLRKKGK